MPVEISTIVSGAMNMGNMGNMGNYGQFGMPQNVQNQINQQNVQNAQNAANSQNAQTSQSVSSASANGPNTSGPAPTSTTTNQNTTTSNADEQKETTDDSEPPDLLASVLDSFAGNNETDGDSGTMDVDGDTAKDDNVVDTNNNNSNNTNSSNAAANPMSALLNAFSGNSSGGGSGGNPLASLMSAFSGAQRGNNTSNAQEQKRNPLMLINRTLKFIFDAVSINEVQSAQNGKYQFIGNHRNGLRSFVLNTILNGNDTPMRRHEIAMDFANGFGLFMISQFSSERRDVIRSQTVNHFKNHTPSLIDIVLDSGSESVFAERMSG